MGDDDRGQITQLLTRWIEGDRDALESLAPLVQAEMRKIADGYLRRERGEHTLQPTALVNEAWLRLANPAGLNFGGRKQFFGLAAQIMRQILVDYARGSRAEKRGRGEHAVSLDDLDVGAEADIDGFLALSEAIDRLAEFSPRQARVIELRYFGGLNLEEVSELLSVSPATISREQKSAEAWLSRTMDSTHS